MADKPQGARQVLLSIRTLFFAYRQKNVLQGISLDFKAGRLCGLMGPNGSGKTTLFKCCLGLLRANNGSITLEGRPLAAYRPRELATRLAYVPQEHKPAFPYTVREMVEMGRTPHRRAVPILSKADHRAVDKALERLGLGGLAKEHYNCLSSGERQLVLVARALAQEATLLFLDEPTSSLDFSNQLIVWEAVRSLTREGLGAVICCHDPNHILWFCDEVAVLKEGSLLAEGSVEATITRELVETVYDRPVQMIRSGSRSFIGPVLKERENSHA